MYLVKSRLGVTALRARASGWSQSRIWLQSRSAAFYGAGKRAATLTLVAPNWAIGGARKRLQPRISQKPGRKPEFWAREGFRPALELYEVVKRAARPWANDRRRHRPIEANLVIEAGRLSAGWTVEDRHVPAVSQCRPPFTRAPAATANDHFGGPSCIQSASSIADMPTKTITQRETISKAQKKILLRNLRTGSISFQPMRWLHHSIQTPVEVALGD